MDLKIKIGMASCGLAAGANDIYNAVKDYQKVSDIDISLEKTGCIGMCFAEPLMEIIADGNQLLMVI